MKEQKSKKLKIAVVILAVLLAVSSAALAGTLIINHFSRQKPTSVEVPGNVIAPSNEDSFAVRTNSPSTMALSGRTGKEAASSVPTDQPDPTSASEAVPEQTDARAVGTISAREVKASAITLHNQSPEDNVPFQATNLFPGDTETKYYCIQVSYKGDIVVRYHADIRPGCEKLAEVLKVKIRLLGSDELLYDGLMRDMPKSLNHALDTNESTQSELYYEITAYLDTSVGNDYMDKHLIADFRWWVEETGNLEPPQTGDSANIGLWICLASASALMLLFLVGKRRKEECGNG